jgi:hypothetical protein
MSNPRPTALPARTGSRSPLDHLGAASVGAARSRTGGRTIAAIAAAALVVAGCRGDSFTSPNVADCTGQAGCHTPVGAQAAPEVFASLTDAASRLVPSLGAPASQQQPIVGAINALARALQQNRYADARASLAQVYELIAPFRIRQSDGTEVDTPDVAAIRLDLVPAANTLGVHIQ